MDAFVSGWRADDRRVVGRVMASFVGDHSSATGSGSAMVRQLELLHTAHYVGLVRLAVALVDREDLAEEIVQESFLQLFQRWGRLRDSELAPAYLRRAVINRSRDELRSRRIRRNHLPKPPDPASSSEDQVLEAERDRDVVQALAALPARQREVLVLRYFAGLSEREIADAIGRPIGTVKSAAHRGLANLRRSLGDSFRDFGGAK